MSVFQPARQIFRQRGAAALMIVLFLLIVSAFAVVTSLSMSGSDIGDTAYQHNGVAALALAESGLEQVAGSMGGGCAALGTGGPYNLGNGSFSVVAPAPYIDTGMCRARVSGTVGGVTRTLDAWFSGAGGAIAVDATVSPAGAKTNNLVFAVPVTGANRLLLLGLTVDSAKTTVTGVTYNGVSLTLAGTSGAGGNPEADIWYMTNPPVGTYNLRVTLSASDEVIAGVTVFRGVDMTTPIENSIFPTTFNTNVGTVTLATLTPGAWLADVISVDKGRTADISTTSPVVAGAARTQSWSKPSGGAITGAGSTYGPIATPTSVTLNWTLGGSQKWTMPAVAIKPAGATQVARWQEVVQ